MTEYNEDEGLLIARTMYELNNKEVDKNKSHLQIYRLNKAFRKFGQAAYDSACKEMNQLHERRCFYPININALSPREKKEQ